MPTQTTFRLPQLTPFQLEAMTPPEVVARADRCRVVGRNYSTGSRIGFQRSRPRYPVWYNEMRVYTICPKRDKPAKKRYSYVRFYGPPSNSTPVWVWCSCEHFGYTYEWVLAQYGSSSLSPGYEERGPSIWNQPPIVRNESQNAGVCKHLVLAMREGLKQTRDLAGAQGQLAASRGAATVEMEGNRPRIVVPRINLVEEGDAGLFDQGQGQPGTGGSGPGGQESR